ncbi:MAG: universal stress protein [Desulfovibrio sp.]|jgi:nucleotide-binding universal stress UspA family protein|nr:universal stress protein [Desulfovibrio sp.]
MSTFTVKNILCPIDFSQNSELAASRAAAAAEAGNAALEFLYVSPLLTDIGGHHEVDIQKLQDMEQHILSSAAASMEKFIKAHAAGAKAAGKVLPGDPGEVILQRAKEIGADLIVIGTRGRKGFDNILFGSVAEKIVRLATVSVLVVR